MAKLIIDGLTMKQAKTLADWFEGQGEQDACEWFDINDVPAPMTDVQRKDYEVIDKEAETVTIQCK